MTIVESANISVREMRKAYNSIYAWVNKNSASILSFLCTAFKNFTPGSRLPFNICDSFGAPIPSFLGSLAWVSFCSAILNSTASCSVFGIIGKQRPSDLQCVAPTQLGEIVLMHLIYCLSLFIKHSAKQRRNSVVMTTRMTTFPDSKKSIYTKNL